MLKKLYDGRVQFFELLLGMALFFGAGTSAPHRFYVSGISEITVNLHPATIAAMFIGGFLMISDAYITAIFKK